MSLPVCDSTPAYLINAYSTFIIRSNMNKHTLCIVLTGNSAYIKFKFICHMRLTQGQHGMKCAV